MGQYSFSQMEIELLKIAIIIIKNRNIAQNASKQNLREQFFEFKEAVWGIALSFQPVHPSHCIASY